jgi:hypothetical protein
MKNRKTMRKYGRRSIRYTRTRKRSERDREEGDICQICLNGFTQQDETYTHPQCNKKFHINCIKQWCANKEVCTCPNCKGTDIDLPLEYDELYQKYKGLENDYKQIYDNYTELEKELEVSQESYQILRNDYNNLLDDYNLLDEKYSELVGKK